MFPLMLTNKKETEKKEYLKIDVSIREPVGTSFIEEVNVFD